MGETLNSGPVRIRTGEDGIATYLLALMPDQLPAVRPRDLAHAWDTARDAAIRAEAGPPVRFAFRRPDGSISELALADRDACCWARAVEAAIGLGTCYGISLCLRLLALVDLLTQSRWADRLVRLARDGAELHPALLRAAATLKLDEAARLDPHAVRDNCAADLSLPAPALAALPQTSTEPAPRRPGACE